MKLLGSGNPTDKSFFPGEERELLERLLVAERHIADLRAREARLLEAVRWAAGSSRGLGLTEVAELLEALVDLTPYTKVPGALDSEQPTEERTAVTSRSQKS